MTKLRGGETFFLMAGPCVIESEERNLWDDCQHPSCYEFSAFRNSSTECPDLEIRLRSVPRATYG